MPGRPLSLPLSKIMLPVARIRLESSSFKFRIRMDGSLPLPPSFLLVTGELRIHLRDLRGFAIRPLPPSSFCNPSGGAGKHESCLFHHFLCALQRTPQTCLHLPSLPLSYPVASEKREGQRLSDISSSRLAGWEVS